MKKILVLTLALVLAFSLASCGGDKNPSGTGDGSKQTESPPVTQSDDNKPAAGNTGEAWPAGWPDDVPQIDGAVGTIIGDDVNTNTGITVYITVTGLDTVKAYADDLADQGFEKQGEDETGGDYVVTMKGTAYKVTISYNASKKEVNLFVTSKM